ncbi:hypothetical protein Lal_00028367 [Lupinus albus]|nr:hypothetical protein Lal_00028367 [Lupinus albus]
MYPYKDRESRLRSSLDILGRTKLGTHTNICFGNLWYGLIPFRHDMVDQAAKDVFEKFRLFDVNLLLVIVVETLLSFQLCHEKYHFKIWCCVQLLYVWMITRFKHHQYPDWFRYPPTEVWKHCGKTNATDRLEKIASKDCVFLRRVPKYDTNGALRMHFIYFSSEHQPRILIWYKDDEGTKDKLDYVRNALKRVHPCGPKELGEHQAFYINEYKLWNSDKRKGKTSPSIVQPQEPSGPSEVELLRG